MCADVKYTSLQWRERVTHQCCGLFMYFYSFFWGGGRWRSVERRNKLNQALGPIVDNNKHQQTWITFLNLSHLHLWTAYLNSIRPNMSGCTTIAFTGWLSCEYSCVTHSCECCVGALLNSAGEPNPKSLFWVHYERGHSSSGDSCQYWTTRRHIWPLWVLLQHADNTLQPTAEQESEGCLCL